MIEETRRTLPQVDVEIAVPIETLAPDRLQSIEVREDWWVDRVRRWRWRHPVSVHLIDNSLTGLPSMKWGPGPFGRAGRSMASVMALAFVGFQYGVVVVALAAWDFMVTRFRRRM